MRWSINPKKYRKAEAQKAARFAEKIGLEQFQWERTRCLEQRRKTDKVAAM